MAHLIFRMSNNSSRRKKGLEEPYIRPSLLRLTRTDSIATDATSPNNAGPGRNLGLLFDAVGEKLERFVNNTAGRYKLGPRTIDSIAEDIQSLHHIRREKERDLSWRTGLQTWLTPTDEEYTALKKLCRKLLKHCRSHELAVQLKALEAVSSLAVHDLHVRQMFADLLPSPALIPKYTEYELQVESHKALISVKDNEVYDFHSRLIYICRRAISDDDPDSDLIVEPLKNRFESFLEDPDVSFVLGRLLQRHQFGLVEKSSFLRIYFNVALTRPQVIERRTLEILFDGWMLGLGASERSHTNISLIMRIARKYPVLSPYLTGSTVYPATDESLGSSEAIIWRRNRSLSFLYYLCDSRDLETQWQYLQNMDDDMQKLFQDTIFLNKIFIAITHAIASLYDLDRSRCTNLETSALTLLDDYLYGNPNERALAKEGIRLCLRSNRYFKSALVALMLQRKDSADLAELLQISSRRELFRNIEINPAKEDMDMYDDDILYSSSDDYEWLEVRGDEKPFDVTGHFPILAGFDEFGREIYRAHLGFVEIRLKRQRFYTFTMFSYVADGARSISIADQCGEVRVFSKFYVMVLKHDPCDVAISCIPADAKLQTGSVFWMRDEEGRYEDDMDLLDSAWEWGPDTGGQIDGGAERFDEVDGPENNYTVKCSDTKSNSDENKLPTETVLEGFESKAARSDDETWLGQHKFSDVERVEEVDTSAELQHARRELEEEERELEARRKASKIRRRELEKREQEFKEYRVLQQLRSRADADPQKKTSGSCS